MKNVKQVEKRLLIAMVVLCIGASAIPTVLGDLPTVQPDPVPPDVPIRSLTFVTPDVVPPDVPIGTSHGTIGTIPDAYVDDDYTPSTLGWSVDHFARIQDGINAVDKGGTVYVYSGTYRENIVIKKSLVLSGENKLITVIDGGGIGSVVEIKGASVVISGFTIQHSGSNFLDAGIYAKSDYERITDTRILNNNVGIYLLYGSYSWWNKIKDNTISDNQYAGIYLGTYSQGYTIQMNTITDNGYGCFIEYTSVTNQITGNIITNNHMDGIYLQDSSSYNIISENTVSGNKRDGIHLGTWCTSITIIDNLITENSNDGIHLLSSSGIRIDGNDIIGNSGNGVYLFASSWVSITTTVITNNERDGIYLDYSPSNTIQGDTITGNFNIGIYLFDHSTSNTIIENEIANNVYGIYIDMYSSANTIYHNSLIDNAIANAYDYAGGNIWDNGYPSGGNYWSDYTGVDLFHGPSQDIPGSDGIGDTPYSISLHGQDQYPLMSP